MYMGDCGCKSVGRKQKAEGSSIELPSAYFFLQTFQPTADAFVERRLGGGCFTASALKAYPGNNFNISAWKSSWAKLQRELITRLIAVSTL